MEILPRDTSKCLENLRFGPNHFLLFEMLNFSFLLFLGVMLFPQLFRMLREIPGNNFHLVSSESKRGCPSCDQTTHLILLLLTVLVLTAYAVGGVGCAPPNPCILGAALPRPLASWGLRRPDPLHPGGLRPPDPLRF